MSKQSIRWLACVLAVLFVVNLCPVSAFAAPDRLTTTISSPSTVVGSTFTVDVTLANNPGISAYKIMLSYDESLLTLNSVTYNTGMGGNSVPPQRLSSPVTLYWYSGLTDVSFNGKFATLEFSVAEGVAEDAVTQITVSYDEEDITNTAQDTVPMAVVDGTVSIFLVRPGDINGDTKTNNKDLVCLAQYLANWDVTVNEVALDTNGDGKVNNKDLVLLAQFLANWDVEIFPKVEAGPCRHALTHVDAVAATCVEAGHIEYWVCEKCGKYFRDATAAEELTYDSTVLPVDPHNHANVEVIPAVPATYTSTGNEEGWRCRACGVYELKIIPILEPNTYSVTYRVAGNDSYLASIEIDNSENASYYIEGVGIPSLYEPEVPGYIFEGWYDGQGSSANRVTSISTSAKGNKTLYAHWSTVEYNVNFVSNLYPIDSISYTVNTGAVLPIPALSNYVFTGWTDSNGALYGKTTIPVGTTGNLTLTANWTSERNKAATYTSLRDPIVFEDEDNNVIYFIYEIGEMQNVPLYTVKDFGYISGDGITKTETASYSMSVTEGMAQSYAKAVSDGTTRSANWTLASGWSESTDVDEKWRNEHEFDIQEARVRGTSETGNWNVSNSNGGSYTATHLSSSQTNKTNEVKLNNGSSSTNSAKVAAGLKSTLGAEAFGVEAKVEASLSAEDSVSNTSTSGVEVGGSTQTTNLSTNSTAKTSTWNTSSSYGGSNTSSLSESTSYAIADKISEEYGYGHSYVTNGNTSNTEGTTNSRTSSEEYSSTVTYSRVQGETVTRTWTTQATKPGYHRWVVAGTMHVFAVVGYNMETRSFFVNNYSLMDDYTYEFEDYSYSSIDYSDNQNGLISFAVPTFVHEYVAEKTAYSNGLIIDMDTGVITAYTGTDTGVIIPDYMPVYSFTDGNGTDHYDIVKVTGISETAFKGNKDIVAVQFPAAVSEIPAYAFQGCTSLVGILGGTITAIGESAFDGCTSIACAAIHPDVTYVGDNAFNGAQRILVNASNASVVEAAVNSGAKSIVIYTNHLNGDTSGLRNKTLTIPEGTEYFELNGYSQEFQDMQIVSKAGKTVLNKVNLDSDVGTPLLIASDDLVLNQSYVVSNSLCLILSADTTNIGLQGNISLSSRTAFTTLSHSINLYQNVSNANGSLSTSSDMLVHGAVTNQQLLARQGEEIVTITQEEYDLYSSGLLTITWDVNGGNGLTDSTSEVFKNYPIDYLPQPERDYYEFAGWYTDPENGSLVTAGATFSEDTTLYAHWTPRTYLITFNANGSDEIFESVMAYCDQEIGELPVPTRGLYTFGGWFTELEGGEQVTSTTVRSVAEDMFLYAHWTANQHTVTFVPNGYNVVLGEYSRTVTCDSPIGTLPAPTLDYHYFDGWYTEDGIRYTDSTVITIDSDFSLYAHWTLNDMHDWTPASEVPADAEIVEEKWTYSRTTEKESTASSMSGWTQIGDYWSEYASGTRTYAYFPSTFDTGHWIYKQFDKSPFEGWDNGSTKREVTNTRAGYVYWHWAYNAAYYNNTNRWISDRDQVAGASRGLSNYGYNYFYAFTSTTDAPRLYDFTYTWGANAKYDSGAVTYNCSGCLPGGADTSSTSGLNNPRFLRFDYYTSTYKDSQHIYKYRLVENNLESSTAVSSGNGISNVQHWVRYRDRVQINMLEDAELELVDDLANVDMLVDDVPQSGEENSTGDTSATVDTSDPAEGTSNDTPVEAGQTSNENAGELENEVGDEPETNAVVDPEENSVEGE